MNFLEIMGLGFVYLLVLWLIVAVSMSAVNVAVKSRRCGNGRKN